MLYVVYTIIIVLCMVLYKIIIGLHVCMYGISKYSYTETYLFNVIKVSVINATFLITGI